MEKKRVLILGACGFVGSFLSPYLQQNNWDVEAVDLCWFGNYLDENIPLTQKDIFDLKADDLRGFDNIIFLAGLSNDPMAEFSPKDNFIYNTAMPAYIGYMAKEAGVKKMMFASSCSVYGFTHNQTFMEDDITICDYPYGVSKLQGEKSLLALADENFSVVCFRQGTVSGYSPRMRLDLAINTMFWHAVEDKEIQLSNNKIWRPILGTLDLCEAYLLALNKEDWSEIGTVNISSFNSTIGDLAEEVAYFVEEKFGYKVAIHNKGIQDYRNYKVSTEKAANLLGYEGKETCRGILEDLYKNIDKFTPFNQERFFNIQVFQKIMQTI
jgi:nucleoside-diphosphate-sugar epimerase